MSENSDKDSQESKDSSEKKTEKFSGQNIANVESENIISNQEQEIMEVHKHPHDVTHKKKWTEYLLEFLMIFFAVTMGFVAENMREQTVEKHREKQFMISLVRDLELDTAELSVGLKVRLQKIQAMDSAITILADQNTSQVPGKAYNLSRMFWGSRNFYQNSGTLDQLKNSGGLRLISNRKIVDAIEAYDQHIKRMKVINDVEVEAFVYNDRLSQKLWDAKSVLRLHPSSEYPYTVPDPSPLIMINLSCLNEYVNNIMSYRPLVKGNAFLFESSKQKAIDLIQLIKKEYHLQ